MNKKTKQLLKQGFEAPAPTRKQAFLRYAEAPPISCFEFLLLQVTYIRKFVWILSVLIFAVSLTGSKFFEKDMLWCISSFMPLLALLTVTESGRSESFGMAEFEMSARFSMRNVVIARLCVLGASNLILMCLLVPLAFISGIATLFQTGVYIFCPYLLAAFSGMWVMRKIRGEQGVYVCAGISAGISAGLALLYQSCPVLLAEGYFAWWIAAAVILGGATAKQCYQMVQQTEELICS